MEVVAPGEKAILVSGATEAMDVVVQGFFFTPHGLKYQLEHEDPAIRWTVDAASLQPMNGVTKMLLYNPNTGDTKPKPTGLSCTIRSIWCGGLYDFF